MRKRLTLYGWFDPVKTIFFVSRYPADAPVRPAVRFEQLAEAKAWAIKKRADIMWWPPLPEGWLSQQGGAA